MLEWIATIAETATVLASSLFEVVGFLFVVVTSGKALLKALKEKA